jgi:MarR family transcriptional regulator, transcriptional regulator for hemolysin
MDMPKKTAQPPPGFSHPSIDEGIEMLEQASRLSFRIFENSAGFLLGNASARLRLEMLRSFKIRGYTITPDQWVVLNAVAEHEGICQRDLAGKTLKDRPTVTRILDILEENRLIARRPGTDDRRMFNVYLTEEGKKNIETFNSIVSEIDRKAFGNFSEQEMSRFKKTLAKIMENIESRHNGNES